MEDAELIIIVSPTKNELKVCEIKIENWINLDKVNPIDISDIKTMIDQIEWETGKWKVKIHITWIDLETRESEWDILEQTKL